MDIRPATGEGDLLWQPTPEQADATRLAAYQRWLAAERGVDLPDYDALWQWSVNDIDRILVDDLGLLRRPGRRLPPAGARLAGDARCALVPECPAELRRACLPQRHAPNVRR